ncbi:two-component system chemotaxis sensor kinase CheA [Hydrogenivirga caldilitoris]|uniref:histidine kinase n=1 Tax=Hydrogenivirga caldilitoris TaxID=246264 RepID=A0A497XQ68_9AQUI|nr:chemotaxis protein CheA [Hydrogenivirga caldilitoris]RLJ71126.1 two-component system chemotaxis sensor kinase CheA [Hydrogenivirga caldilitoris]
MISDDMREIFNEFVVEAEENLHRVEEALLELERDPKNEELLNATFRAMHTLKGGAGFLGLNAIVEVAHAAEDVLGKLRSGELTLTPEINDAVLEAVDFIRSALSLYESGEQVETPRDLIERLRELQSGSAVAQKGEGESSIDDLLERYGFAHLKGKPIEDILEELILLPPDERPLELIDELDKIVASGGAPEEVALPEERALETVQEELEGEPKPEEKEEVLPETKKAPVKAEGEKILRIDVQKIEALMNLVGELVLERNRLLRVFQKLYEEYQSKTVDEFETVMSSLDRIVGDLQLAVMKTRMQPVKRLFQKFPRVVRDLARMLGKEVELVLEGEDAEMDKTVLEKLEEPLIHLIRNAVDHGIELPDERVRLGKPRKGTVKLSAYYHGDRIFIEIADDGRGIDIERVKKKALEKGIISPDRAEKMTEKDLLFLIFHPGFSTAEGVSQVSGRGVGMDVVMNTVSAFRGTIDIETEHNNGTRIILSFPLTVGIIRSLLVSVGGRLFAIPIYSVLEIIQGEDAQITTVSGKEVLILRELTIPLINLGEALEMGGGNVGYVIVSQVGSQKVAFTVEELFGDEEVVVKPLGKIIGEIQGISGATITGDGKVVLILDLDGILKREMRTLSLV